MREQQGLWTTLAKKSSNSVTTEMTFWRRRHIQRLFCVLLTTYTKVAEDEVVFSLWLRLDSLYTTKSLTNKLLLKQRLLSLRMNEGTPLIDHLAQLNTILLELRNIDIKVEDEDVSLENYIVAIFLRAFIEQKVLCIISTLIVGLFHVWNL